MALENNEKNHLLDWRNWVKGLVASAINGAASSVTVMIVDPTNFNLQEGSHKLISVAVVSMITGVALYLKQSPLPQEKE